ncbi:MAG: hypothetical protein H6607_12225 [Flavobacteriales bacterium]|nr:hypothetical protein [Flavobacteriales bacterium]
MQIIQVETDTDFGHFLNVPKLIYANDPVYIPHIKQELTKLLWKRSKPATLFLAKKDNQFIGRIAAFINDGNKGGIGFFECINDLQTAKALFNAAENHLNNLNISTFEAPVNYGRRDKFWGLLTLGFDSPSYQENYNPNYYKALIEQCGYEQSFVQHTYQIAPEYFNYEKTYGLSKNIFENRDIEIKHIEKNKIKQYARDFTTIYNNAWKKHEHYEPLSYEQVLKTMNAMKPVLREDLAWFTYVKGQPAAFYISIIEINQILKYVNGNMNWLGKLKFLYYRKRVPIKIVRGLIFGVVPEFQAMGITSGMMIKMYEVVKNDPHLAFSELAWIGDFNPRMMHLMEAIGTRQYKEHTTFQKKL